MKITMTRSQFNLATAEQIDKLLGHGFVLTVVKHFGSK